MIYQKLYNTTRTLINS